MPFAIKQSTRLSSNVSLRLTDRCLIVTTRIVTKVANERTKIRNARDKKSIRNYFYNNLPASLHQEILQKAIQQSLGAQSILNLLDLFEPAQDARYKVDLLGPLRLRIGCCRAGNSRWFIRPLTEYNLTEPQLEQLYNILIWSNPKELREIALSTSSISLKSSKIPNILARGRALTKVTLLECADNHILRILGISCSRLKHLDISHSLNVTTNGLFNLFLSRPPWKSEYVGGYSNGDNFFIHARLQLVQPRRSLFLGGLDLRSQKRNPCAQTIVSIKLQNTPLQTDLLGCEYVCTLLENCYKLFAWPFTEIVRIVEPEGVWEKEIPLNPATRKFPPCTGLSDEVVTAVSMSFGEALLDPWFNVEGVWMTSTLVADHLIPNLRKPTAKQESLLFIGSSLGQLLTHLRMVIKVERTEFVTSVVSDMCCTFSLDLIGQQFPHLKHFRARITGVWGFERPFLPNLEVISAWCENSTTILSILQDAPSIKLCELNNTRLGDPDDPDDPDDNMMLNDSTLEQCLLTNRRLSESLEEIVIQPCWLTLASLHVLVNNCPNVKIIGDLQSWRITSREIGRFNKHLDKIGSQCVLSIMNSPQPKIKSFKWI